MMLIYKLIERLEEGEGISADEQKVVAYMLKEMMLRDTKANGIMIVQMSPEMYDRFITYAYTKNGTYKNVELNK